MANQGNPGGPTPQQQQQQQQPRMMRPVMANNPGLRHLLQQVCVNKEMVVVFRVQCFRFCSNPSIDK